MGMIINIDEALKLRSEYNILREPLNEMLRRNQEAWEQQNPIDFLYVRNSIGTFQETYTSSIGFAHAFAETGDYMVGPIFNTAEGFSATYRTRTFQGSFIITQQTLEDRQMGRAKDDANSFIKRWHGDTVEYAMAAMSSGFGEEVVWGTEANGGKSKLKLSSADTVDGTLDGVKNPLFTNKHTIVKRDDSKYTFTAKTATDTVTDCQSNKYYVDIDIKGDDSAKIVKLAEAINEVITAMENYKDDNGKYAPLLGEKRIVCANDPYIKAALKTALGQDMFCIGESKFNNPSYERVGGVDTTPYLLAIPQCAAGKGFFIVDKAYNAENHGPEFTERIVLTLDVIEQKRPKGIIYDGRQRFDINVASWRGIAYVYLGTPAGSSGKWDDVNTFTKITPSEAIVKPVSVAGTVNTKASS
jgi:hypothetical protein